MNRKFDKYLMEIRNDDDCELLFAICKGKNSDDVRLCGKGSTGDILNQIGVAISHLRYPSDDDFMKIKSAISFISRSMTDELDISPEEILERTKNGALNRLKDILDDMSEDDESYDNEEGALN